MQFIGKTGDQGAGRKADDRPSAHVHRRCAAAADFALGQLQG